MESLLCLAGVIHQTQSSAGSDKRLFLCGSTAHLKINKCNSIFYNVHWDERQLNMLQSGVLCIQYFDVRIVHLHIVEQADRQWRDYIAFRDAFRRDSKLRQRCASLKKRLAKRHAEDRKAYTEATNRFIREALTEEAQQAHATNS